MQFDWGKTKIKEEEAKKSNSNFKKYEDIWFTKNNNGTSPTKDKNIDFKYFGNNLETNENVFNEKGAIEKFKMHDENKVKQKESNKNDDRNKQSMIIAQNEIQKFFENQNNFGNDEKSKVNKHNLDNFSIQSFEKSSNFNSKNEEFIQKNKESPNIDYTSGLKYAESEYILTTETKNMHGTYTNENLLTITQNNEFKNEKKPNFNDLFEIDFDKKLPNIEKNEPKFALPLTIEEKPTEEDRVSYIYDKHPAKPSQEQNNNYVRNQN